MNKITIVEGMDGTQGFDMDLPSHRLTWLPTLLSAQFLNGRNPNMSPFPRRPTSPWITEGLQWIFSIRDWASVCPYGNNHIFWNGFASPGAFTRTIILGFSNYFIHFVHLWIILYNISSGQETHFTVKEVWQRIHIHGIHLYTLYHIEADNLMEIWNCL